MTHPSMTHPTPAWHTPHPPHDTPPTPPLHDPPHPHPYMTHPTSAWHTPPCMTHTTPTLPLHDPPPPHPCMTHPTPAWHTPPPAWHTPPYPYMTHPHPTPAWHTPPHPCMTHPTPPAWPTPPPPYHYMTHPTPPHPWYIFGHKGAFFHGLLHYVSLSVDKNGIQKEFRHFVKNLNSQRSCHFCLKLCIFRQKWQIQTKWTGFFSWIFSNYFSAEFSSLIHKELAKLAEMALDLSAEFRQFGTNKISSEFWRQWCRIGVWRGDHLLSIQRDQHGNDQQSTF